MTPEQTARWSRHDSGKVSIWETFTTLDAKPIASIVHDPRDEPGTMYVVRVTCAPGNVAKNATLQCSGSPLDQVVNEAEGFIHDCGWDLKDLRVDGSGPV